MAIVIDGAARSATRNKRLLPECREAFVIGLLKAGEMQAMEIAQRINGVPGRPAEECERDVRSYAVLAKTLRELAGAQMEWRAGDKPAKRAAARPAAPAGETAPDAAPDDLDLLRAALNDQLRRLSHERAAAPVRAPVGSPGGASGETSGGA